jgi:nucleotide-binding universal stress UspA family protein
MRACEKIQAIFPEWSISAEAYVGSAAREIIQRADKWKPDLIVVGSHGRSAMGRFMFGSVSQKVVTEARGSVRVARARARTHKEGEPIKLIIGMDGSPAANAAVYAVAARDWPAGSQARLVTAIGSSALDAANISLKSHDANAKMFKEITYSQGIKQALQLALEKELCNSGLDVSSINREGDPKAILLDEAEEFNADCIFLGSRGFGRIKRFLLGSVSTAVVARAHCSVEVVRVGRER